LTAAKSSPRVAWVLDEQGKRNIFVAEAPDFKARRLTSYFEEDGQELSSLQFLPTPTPSSIRGVEGRSRRTIAESDQQSRRSGGDGISNLVARR